MWVAEGRAETPSPPRPLHSVQEASGTGSEGCGQEVQAKEGSLPQEQWWEERAEMGAYRPYQAP